MQNNRGSIIILDVTIKYSFIVRQEHIDKYNIDAQIKKYLPEANIFTVQQTTRGAVETCLIAASAIDDEDGIIINLASKEYSKCIENHLSENARMITAVFAEMKQVF